MKLKKSYNSMSEVPEALREFYREEGGKAVLDAEGVEDVSGLKSALEKEREERRAAKEALAAFDGLDPEEYRTLKAEQQKAKEKKLIDAGKVEELIAERIGAMKADHEKQLKSLTEAKAKGDAQLEKLVIDNAIQGAAAKAGVRSTAMEDVLLRGRSLFRLQDGQAVPYREDKVLYGKDPNKPLSIDEWVDGLKGDAVHLFEPSTGGGAKPGAGSSQPGAGQKVMARSAFTNLPPAEQMAFAKAGGTLTD